MKTKQALKLSEMPDDMELSVEESNTVYTVAELKDEIVRLGEDHHQYSTWYTIDRRKWHPNATKMLETYIESEQDDMYEDWDERAWDCLTAENISKIQFILDEVFKGDHATAYWGYDKEVIIDVFPVGVK